MALFASNNLLIALWQSEKGSTVGTKEQRPWYQ